MQHVINNVLNQAWTRLTDQLQNGHTLCDAKGWYRHENALDYNNPVIQSLYVLRYFPAYLAEYYLICRQILNSHFLSSSINMVSLGCGCAPEAAAMHFAGDEHGRNIQSIVIDAVCWHPYLTIRENKFINASFETVPSYIFDTGNVLFFPKSLIECSSTQIDKIANLIRNNPPRSDKIVLVNSTPRRIDSQWCEIVDAFRDTGYFVEKTENLDHLDKRSFASLLNGRPNRRWDYPQEIIENLKNLQSHCPNHETCANDCHDLNRHPVLTYQLTSMHDEIVYLNRERAY